MLILNKDKESLINNLEVVHFDFPENDFYIEFSEGKWKAISHNDEEDSIIIIEDLENGVRFEYESIELFSNFIFEKNLFERYKIVVGEKIIF